MLAIAGGFEDVVILLIECGADVSFCAPPSSEHPMHVACEASTHPPHAAARRRGSARRAGCGGARGLWASTRPQRFPPPPLHGYP